MATTGRNMGGGNWIMFLLIMTVCCVILKVYADNKTVILFCGGASIFMFGIREISWAIRTRSKVD